MNNRLAIINADGSLERVCFSTDGHDLTGRTVVANVPDAWPATMRWDVPSQTFVLDLSALSAELQLSIDNQAEAARMSYITPGAGQALEYAKVADEIVAYRAAAAPVATDYPFVNSQAKYGSVSFETAMAQAMAAYDAWNNVLGPMIRGRRLDAKANIRAATTEAGKRAAAAVSWAP